jgi:hypothetical protein
MEQAKHTPGPWKLTSMSTGHIVADKDGRSLAPVSCNWDIDGMGSEMMTANAHLMAASPTMLEALSLMVKWAELHGLTRADLISGGQAEVPVITIARAAIVKAIGGAA